MGGGLGRLCLHTRQHRTGCWLWSRELRASGRGSAPTAMASRSRRPLMRLLSLPAPFLSCNRSQNYKELFRRVSTWLRPGGLLFFHIFVHSRGLPYHFEVLWGVCFLFCGAVLWGQGHACRLATVPPVCDGCSARPVGAQRRRPAVLHGAGVLLLPGAACPCGMPLRACTAAPPSPLAHQAATAPLPPPCLTAPAGAGRG